jgi:hypothetical protein
MNLDHLLFAGVDLPMFDKQEATAEILKIAGNSFWDTYRLTTMIPLMTKTGKPGYRHTSNYLPGSFQWADYTPSILVDWFETVGFPWLGMKTRVMALITEPNFANAEHIDCKLHEINTRQHKFRIVLQGSTDTLYFKTTKGNITVPSVETPFLMDGGWVHGMHNTATERKVTLALGAPWNGLADYGNEVNLLMNRNDYQMPDDLKSYL